MPALRPLIQGLFPSVGQASQSQSSRARHTKGRMSLLVERNCDFGDVEQGVTSKAWPNYRLESVSERAEDADIGHSGLKFNEIHVETSIVVSTPESGMGGDATQRASSSDLPCETASHDKILDERSAGLH